MKENTYNNAVESYFDFDRLKQVIKLDLLDKDESSPFDKYRNKMLKLQEDGKILKHMAIFVQFFEADGRLSHQQQWRGGRGRETYSRGQFPGHRYHRGRGYIRGRGYSRGSSRGRRGHWEEVEAPPTPSRSRTPQPRTPQPRMRQTRPRTPSPLTPQPRTPPRQARTPTPSGRRLIWETPVRRNNGGAGSRERRQVRRSVETGPPPVPFMK